MNNKPKRAPDSVMTAAEWQAWMARTGNHYQPRAMREALEAEADKFGAGFEAKAQKPGQQEHDMQVDFVEKFREKYPDLKRVLFCIPNGAKVPYKRIKKKNGQTITVAPERQKLIDEGLQNGVPDIHLAVARGSWKGLYIELKVHPNKPSLDQIEMFVELMRQGYACQFGYTVEMCMLIVDHYLTCETR